MVFMPHWPFAFSKGSAAKINRDFERSVCMMERLGNPHLKIPPVIHVAGTNGKGSTLAYLKYFFEEAGYKIHRYTSPHIYDFNERIQLAGYDIDCDYLFEILEECRVKLGSDYGEGNSIDPTFFEGTTAAAFLAFSRNDADIVLLETGMGGRLDTTNVITSPILSIITTISFDHMQYLGDTIEKIAFEKAGIIKAKVPVISSYQTPEANNVIKEHAMKLNAPAYIFGENWGIMKNTSDGMDFVFDGQLSHYQLPALQGYHQICNAGNAILATKLLKQFSISDNHINSALKKVFWPGRMQKITNGAIYNMIDDNMEIWFDGAHNQAGAECVAQHIITNNDYITYVIIGLTYGKNVEEFLQPLLKLPEILYTINVKTEPSAYSAQKLQSIAINCGFNAKSVDNFSDAIEDIMLYHRNRYNQQKAKIMICGSLYLISDLAKESGVKNFS